jgi:hypothetical protein
MSQQIVAVDLTQAPSTSQLFTPGRIYWDENGRLWQFVKGAATIAQYEYVKVSTDGNFTITSMTTTTNASTEPAEVGCVQATGGFTSTKYGWVFRGFGAHTGLFAASCVQDVKIYTTATNGVVDDSATTLVNGLKLITTIVGAAASPAWASGKLLTAVA